MAVVVWLFAGGGEAEIRGLVPFLNKHFQNCLFHRITPVIRKPGPRPGITLTGYGKTGKSLVVEIKDRLSLALTKGSKCDLILVIDDLDCRDEHKQREVFIAAINSVEGSDNISKFVGFSSPELESWIIADWNNSIACHPDFRRRHNGMRHWLSTERKIPFDAPESFGIYDKNRDCCDQKMSSAIIESSMITEEDSNYPRYSKGTHTPILLQEIIPNIVMGKCPLFKQLFSVLAKLNEDKT
jgi:hypothetical protein